MIEIGLIQLGVGTIGRELLSQVRRLGLNEKISFKWLGIFRSQAALIDSGGLEQTKIDAFIQGAKFPEVVENFTHSDLLKKIFREFGGTTLLVDVRASDQTQQYFELALEHGAGVVSANKIPFSSALTNFESMMDSNGYLYSPVRMEATVGAGLPILSSLAGLIETGDEVLEIQGCFSGTLGFLFSSLSASKSFSESLSQAQDGGMTEPDPREDLSGMDVARKVLILSRLLGWKGELEDVKVENLIPESYRKLSLDEFGARCGELNAHFEERVLKARSERKVLRYIGMVSAQGLRVEVREVSEDSVIGSLEGADNLCAIRTRRYSQPLIIRGPGAGPSVTAAGVFHDILELARILPRR